MVVEDGKLLHVLLDLFERLTFESFRLLALADIPGNHAGLCAPHMLEEMCIDLHWNERPVTPVIDGLVDAMLVLEQYRRSDAIYWQEGHGKDTGDFRVSKKNAP
ncbi:MAG: hypothetical protein QCH35_06905 [Methanomicrobiaceae archaeon]|nr:hypothetical protein [Methanomicrobiaceae archaeon]